MALPRIPATDSVVVPATTAKTYPDLFVSGFRVSHIPGSDGRMTVNVHPYNYDADEVLPSAHVAAYTLRDLDTEIQRVPVLGEALLQMRRVGGLLFWEARLVDHIEGLAKRIRDLETRIAIAPAEEKPVLEAQTAALRSQRTDAQGELTIVRNHLGIE